MALITEAFLSLLIFFRTLLSNGYLFPFLPCFLLLFFSQLFVRPPQTNLLLFSFFLFFFFFLHFFFLGIILVTASYTMSWSSAHSSSGTVSDLISWVCLSLPLYNHKGFDLVIPEWSSGFPYFLKYKCEFGNKELMIWATVSSWSCFCGLYRACLSLAAKNIISLISVLTIWWMSII